MIPSSGGVQFINPSSNQNASILSMLLPEPLEIMYSDLDRGVPKGVLSQAFGNVEILLTDLMDGRTGHGFSVIIRLNAVHALGLIDRIE